MSCQVAHLESFQVVWKFLGLYANRPTFYLSGEVACDFSATQRWTLLDLFQNMVVILDRYELKMPEIISLKDDQIGFYIFPRDDDMINGLRVSFIVGTENPVMN
jgi:hypothetical protein